MSSNIRFHVHEEEYFEETILDQVIDIDRSSDALFAIMNMIVILEPIFNILDPIQIAIQNSENDHNLIRQNEIKLDITSQPYNSTDKKYDMCSICTDVYDQTENVSVLNCGHIYHPKCINEWGKYKQACPLCNTEILVHYDNFIFN
jgi:hypothetical protein